MTGPLAGREKDELGMAFALERNSQKYRIASGNPVDSEKSMELGYRYHAIPALVVQPFWQYLLNHGNNHTQNKTWWLGVRMEATL